MQIKRVQDSDIEDSKTYLGDVFRVQAPDYSEDGVQSVDGIRYMPMKYERE